MKIRNNYLTPNPLTHLSKCEILVFGANIKGEHKGAFQMVPQDNAMLFRP